MGITVTKLALINGTEKAILDQESAKILVDTVNRIRGGEYPKSYVDALFQKSSFSSPFIDLYDAYGFAKVHHLVYSGQMGVFCIRVGKEPVSDRKIQEMNSILEALPPPFNAKHYGGPQDEDGYICWDSPVHCVVTVKEDGILRRMYSIARPTQYCPLEIGYNGIDKTLHTLLFDGMLARWPYESEYIYVFTNDLVGQDDPAFEALLSQCADTMDTAGNPWDIWRLPAPARPAVMQALAEHKEDADA